MAGAQRVGNQHRIPRTGASLLLGLLFLTSTFAVSTSGTSTQPDTWTIPPVLVGDQAKYNFSSMEETYTVLDDTRMTRDTFSRMRQAAVVDVAVAVEDSEVNTTWTVDIPTGVFLYRELSTDQPDGRTDWRRGYSHASTFHLGGAPILAGRTLTPGEELDVPRWTNSGTDVGTARVGSPEMVGTRELLPVTFEDVGVRPYTVWFEEDSPWPVSIEGDTFEDVRVSHARGEGPVAWSVVEDAWPPWEKNPHMAFRDPPAAGPLVEDDPGKHYNVPHKLHQAIAFAEENAEGLAAFREEHGEVAVMETVTHFPGDQASSAPAGVLVFNRSVQGFELLYQAVGSTERWLVEVAVEESYVFGVEVLEEWRLEEEARERWPIDENWLFGPGTHVEYSSWASNAWPELAEWKLDRYKTSLTLVGHGKISYSYTNSGDCESGICFSPIATVTMNSFTGSLGGISGASWSMLEALDETGPWTGLAEG